MSGERSGLELKVINDGHPVVIGASGMLDIATAGRLEAVVGDRLTNGSTVIVDLSGVIMCDSTGLGALVRLERRAVGEDARFVLRNPGRHLTDVLQMTGISKILTIATTDA